MTDLDKLSRGHQSTDRLEPVAVVGWGFWLAIVCAFAAFVGLIAIANTMNGPSGGSVQAPSATATDNDPEALPALSDPDARPDDVVAFVKSTVCPESHTTVGDFTTLSGFTAITCHRDKAPIVFTIYDSKADFVPTLETGIACPPGWIQVVGSSWYAKTPRMDYAQAIAQWGGSLERCPSR